MIEFLEDSKQNLENRIPKLQNLIEMYPKKSSGQKQVMGDKIKKEFTEINTKIEAYETAIRSVKGSEAAPFKSFLAEVKKNMFDLDVEFNRVLTEGTAKSSPVKDEEERGLFGKAGERGKQEENLNLADMEVQQVIAKGDEYQDKTMNVAVSIKRKLEETHKVADNVIIELDKIDEKLKFVSNDLDKADSTMKRLQKYINYFNRQYMGDKVIIGCIITILVVVVIILICSFIFDFDEGNFIDKVKKL